MLLVVVLVIHVATPGDCLTDPKLSRIFYPFGTDVGDSLTAIADDGSSQDIWCPMGFPFFGAVSSYLYVSRKTIFVLFKL